ncbi:MAG: hypothetical protein ACLSGF_06490 [Alistipes onderdonkii]
MTASLHWNGGPGIGAAKLGSGLVGGSKTGGYGKPSDTTVPLRRSQSGLRYGPKTAGGIEELFGE